MPNYINNEKKEEGDNWLRRENQDVMEENGLKSQEEIKVREENEDLRELI